jgi:hypothetical protein
MRKDSANAKVYVVAEVWRGLLTDAKCFRTLRGAETYVAKAKRKDSSADWELGIFERLIRTPRTA